jgi:hypothetical protein
MAFYIHANGRLQTQDCEKTAMPPRQALAGVQNSEAWIVGLSRLRYALTVDRNMVYYMQNMILTWPRTVGCAFKEGIWTEAPKENGMGKITPPTAAGSKGQAARSVAPPP